MELLTNKTTITSREIAEITDKRHADVLKAIRIMEPAWVKVDERKFPLIYYTDKWKLDWQKLVKPNLDSPTMLTIGTAKKLNICSIKMECLYSGLYCTLYPRIFNLSSPYWAIVRLKIILRVYPHFGIKMPNL